MKKYFWIIIICVIYALIAILMAEFSNYSTNNLLINYNVKWHYKNGKWSNISDEEFNKMKLKGYKIMDISTNEYVGKYDLVLNNYWYVENKIYENSMFAYKGLSKLSVIDCSLEELSQSDFDIIAKVLKDKNISGYNELTISDKIIIDYDNDGDNETIYEISNMYAEEERNEFFSTIFIYDNGNYDILEINIVNGDSMFDKNQSIVYAIVDINGDGNYEIIVENMAFSRPDESKFSLYELKNNKYKLAISNS